MDWRIVSIGTLPSHPLWDERVVTRTGHATTIAIKSGDATLLVDPSLPPTILNARLQERWGIEISQITHVFLTSFDPDRRRTLVGLEHAKWFMHAPEIESATNAIKDEMDRAEGDVDVTKILAHHLHLLSKFQDADDRVLPNVDLFPLPGYTPGSCGLLLPTARRTIVIAGDTSATSEHLDQGSVLSNCTDVETAQESFKECIEIADIIVPGRGNVVLNPGRS